MVRPMNTYSARNSVYEQVHRQLHGFEVQRRVLFLGEHRMLRCPEALLRLQASGLSKLEALSAVRAQRSLFYIQFVDVAYFPAFQWRHVQLKPGIGDVLDVLAGWTKWQIALWFVTENGMLDTLRPVDLLDMDPCWVTQAAYSDAGVGNVSH